MKKIRWFSFEGGHLTFQPLLARFHTVQVTVREMYGAALVHVEGDAFADGSSEIIVAGPAGDSTSGSSSEIPVPAPSGGSDSGGCSDADKIALRSAPADNGGDDSGSVTAASAPSCSYDVIEE